MIKQLEEQFVYLQSGQVERALKNIKQMLQDPQMTDELRFNVAQYLYQFGFIEEALAIVKKLVKAYPDETELRLFLAELYMEHGDEDDALTLLNDILPEEEAFVRASLLKADLYLLQGLPEVAEYKLKQALEHYPDEPVLYSALGEVFYQQQNYQLAILHFQKGQTKPYDKLADCYAHLGRFEEALPLYEQALKSNEQLDLLFGHGFVAMQLGKWATACASLEKLLRKDPYYTSAYPLLIRAYLEQGKIEEALEAVEEGLTYDETNPELFYLKGELYLRQGEKEKAKLFFEECLQLDDTYGHALEKLLDLAEEEGDWSSCLNYCQRLRENSLERTDLLIRQGIYYEELEHWAEAEQSFREALEQNPDDVEALNRLAALLRAQGNRQEALALWKKSLSIEPEQWEIADMVEQLEMEGEME